MAEAGDALFVQNALAFASLDRARAPAARRYPDFNNMAYIQMITQL